MTEQSTAVATLTLDTPELEAVEPSKAEQIRNTFVPMADMLREFEDDHNEILTLAKKEVTPEVSARARRLRLDVAKIRIEAEKRRKDLKQEYLLAGRAIDGTNNILKYAINGMEERMREIEEHEERERQRRVEALQAEREDALAAYVEDAHERDLGTMEADVWEAYLAAKKQEHEDRLEAERKAEEERKERERVVKLERERLRELAPYGDHYEMLDDVGAMAEDDYRALLAEAKERKAEHEAAQEELRKERDKLAKQKKAAEAKAKKAEEEERKAEEARKKAEAEAAKAPVKARLTAWVGSFALPELPGDDHEAAQEIRDRFASFREWATERVRSI